MKGLLIKDIRFLMGQKSSLAVFLGLGLFFMVSAENVSLALAYMMMMVAVFATTSISYDGLDNSMAFLMSLPIKRGMYVISKYIIALVLTAVMGSIVLLMALGVNVLGLAAIDLSGIADGFVLSIAAAITMSAILIPIYLKFAEEKSRYAVAVLMGTSFAIAFVLQRVAGDLVTKVFDALKRLSDLPSPAFYGVVLGGAAVVTAISMLISIGVVEKKEY